MIKIQKSKTADTRSCDFSKVTKAQLYASSIQHKEDVAEGVEFFIDMMRDSALRHDNDKLTNINQFHEDFLTGFRQTTWWDNHRVINRHHLLQADGVPTDVNLVDVIELIVDCVMAGKARTGVVYPLDINADVLKRAFDNTVELLKSQVEVEED